MPTPSLKTPCAYTVNFNKKGTAGPAMNAAYMFYNASIQGITRMMKSMTTKKGQKMAMGTIVFAVGMDVLNRMIAGEDEDGENYYDALPDYTKHHNLILMNPFNNSQPFKLPLPYGYNVLHVIGQSISNLYGKQGYGVWDATTDITSSIANSFNPVGTGTALQTIAPTILDTPVMMWENRDFAGNPLKPEQNKYGPEVPEYQLHWSTATEFSKGLAKTLNDKTGGNQVRPGVIDISPETLDLWISQMTGGAGRFAMQTTNVAAKYAKGEKVSTRETPFVRKVYGHENDNDLKRRYYERAKDMEFANKEHKTLRGEQRSEFVKTPQFKLLKEYNATNKRIRSLNRRKRILQDKGRDTQQIDARMRDLMAKFSALYADRVLK